MRLHLDSVVRLKHLKQALEPDAHGDYAVVAWDTDQSIKVSGDLLDILKELGKGKTIREVIAETEVEKETLEAVVEELRLNGLVAGVDGIPVLTTSRKIRPLLPKVPRWIFQILLSRSVLLMGFLWIISGVVVGILKLHYVPKVAHYFWHPDIFVVYATGFIAEIILLAIHEAAHFIATKALGGEAVMRLSRRGMSIVAETESYHLAVIPKQLRYYVYFAGMYVDFVMIASIFWFIYLTAQSGVNVGLVTTFGYSLVLILVTGIVWQYNAYLETDMYNFLSDALDQEQLRANTRKFLALRIPTKWRRWVADEKTMGQAEDLRYMSKRDRKWLVIYGVLLVTGMAALIATFLFIDLPKKLLSIYKTVASISTAANAGNLLLGVRQTALLGLMVYQYIVLILLKRRDKRRRSYG